MIDPGAIARFEEFMSHCMNDDIFTDEMMAYLEEADAHLDGVYGAGESDRLMASFSEQVLGMCPDIASMETFTSVMLGIFLSVEFLRLMSNAADAVDEPGMNFDLRTALNMKMVQGVMPAVLVGVSELGVRVAKTREGALVTKELNESLSVEGDTPDD